MLRYEPFFVGPQFYSLVASDATHHSGGENGGEWGRSVNGELREFQRLGKMDSVLDVVNASGNEVKTIEIVTLSPFEWFSPRFQRRSPRREPNPFCQEVEIL